ncbi:MAG: hypothetical protein E7638_03575 [Ruminococcaceae bacterium]|nr:hypothetical protein [Oscillospiraceae bacterium]
MIKETMYKDRPAISVEGGGLTAVFLPEDGGKMASLRTAAGEELLCGAKGERYLPLTPDGSYVDAECSAFDDMFPAIDPCTIDGHDYPDHGEVCRIPHTAENLGDKLRLSCTVQSVWADYVKEITPEEDGIAIRYEITNRNPSPLPYLWAGHMMFAAHEGDSVFSNAPEDCGMRVMFGNPPEKPNVIGPFSKEGESYKYYLTSPFSPLVCGIDYAAGGRLTASFEGDAVRWLGVWMNNGSFKGMYNLAPEPCTAPYDNPQNAEKEGAASVIPPLGTVTFTLHLKYTSK